MIKRRLAQLLIAFMIAALLMPTVALAAHPYKPHTTTPTAYPATCSQPLEETNPDDALFLVLFVFIPCDYSDCYYDNMYCDWFSPKGLTPNRMFNPRIGRWTQPDPHWGLHNQQASPNAILQSGNLFVGMVNNPVRWTDPTGLFIQLIGDRETKLTLLSYIEKITDHTLGFCSNGMVFIANQATENIQFAYGNALIERMIVHELGVRVSLYAGDNIMVPTNRSMEYEYMNLVGVIFFNPNYQPLIITPNPTTGLNEVGARPLAYSFIGMAHELIHADRAMRDVSIPLHRTGSHSFQVPRALLNPRRIIGSNRGPTFTATHSNVRLEELATVGVGGHHTSTCITENMIRREHGLPMRTTFGYIVGNTRVVH